MFSLKVSNEGKRSWHKLCFDMSAEKHGWAIQKSLFVETNQNKSEFVTKLSGIWKLELEIFRKITIILI